MILCVTELSFNFSELTMTIGERCNPHDIRASSPAHGNSIRKLELRPWASGREV